MIREHFIDEMRHNQYEHADIIQIKRAAKDQRGYAKAVRRWLAKDDNRIRFKHLLPVLW